MNRFLTAAILVLVLVLTASASACPMCSAVLDSEKVLPKAFFVSIMFMLAMPPTVLAVIGFAIWRAHRRHALALQAVEAANAVATETDPRG
jgi:hypothetical protein